MDEIQIKLKERYPNIHPLIFQRSLEKSNSNADLFDILEVIPKKMPIVWDDKNRCWKHTEDLLQSNNYNKKS